MLTLSMIVKNEEKYIRECLQSVDGVVDEIVIVDTGSSDNTIEIAKSFGAKIFHYNWSNDFSAARNFALEKSKSDWILYLDADERLAPKSRNELKKLTSCKNNKAYYCRIINIDNINNRPSVMAYTRLFPNDRKVRFEGAIHEQIEPSLIRQNYQIRNSSIEINHIGYCISKSELKLKAGRNIQILLKEYNKAKSTYTAFHLGQSYGILENKEKAIAFFREAIKDPNLKKEYKSLAYRYIGVSLAESQNWNSALEYVNNSIKCDPDQPLNLLAASEIFLATGKYKEAGDLCYKAFFVNKQFSDKGKFSYQSILLDDSSIIIQGLKVAVTSGDSDLFNIFFPLLKSVRQDENENSFDEFQLYDELLNNKEFSNKKIEGYIKFIDDRNLDLVLALIDKYSIDDSKIILLNKLCNKFPANAALYNKLGTTLMKINSYEMAEEKLEIAYKLNENFPSTIFYLVSVYLQNNKPEKIFVLIESAEVKYKDNPDVLRRLTTLKEKIKL